MSQVWRDSVGKMPVRQKMKCLTSGSALQIRMAPSTEKSYCQMVFNSKGIGPKPF